jgi:xanthine dehydrogenase iron-sulfur cluster and FAD-binding subunit A
LVRPRLVLSLNRIDGRNYVREDRDALRIGAGTRHYEIIRDPMIACHCAVLAEAAAFIGDTQVRNRGTIGGSLAHADPAADYGPVLVASGARVIVRSKRGEREIAADKFFTNLMETALKPDEIATEVVMPKLGAARGAYTRLHRVEGNFAIVNAAAVLSNANARIALGGVGSVPLALDVSAELSHGVNDDALEAVGRRVRAACIDAPADLNASADYRRQMAAVYAQRALAVAAGRKAGQQTPETVRKPVPPASAHKAAAGTVGGTLRTAIAVSVNGQPRRLEADNRMILADLLRDVLGLTGTHIGCGTGSCGACTVMLDGRTVKSCSVLAADVDGCAVETIESLASDIQHLHPIQESFVRNHGQQCGYCTPGMVMSALQLLRDNPNPDETAIRHGISGNLCRCTGYQFIVKSISEAARVLSAGKPQPPA